VGNIKPKKEWSAAIRLNHWFMAVSIVILVATGFFIADPATLAKGETVGKFFMGDIRFWHILFGVVLGFLFLWRIYLAFFSRFHADGKDFLAWMNWKNGIKQVRFYLFLTKEPPEHTHLYGPIQSLAYAGLLTMVFLLVFTGLILMGAGYDAGLTALVYKLLKPFESWLGGLAMVRWIHHILMWGVILFLPVHVYMAFWHDVVFKEGTVSSMISGTVFRRSHR
jgi:Ni/Fe-hydrogenase 1 B-type cytochrome subunit